jgi:multicomponent Na+:H+ antiporter subunit G
VSVARFVSRRGGVMIGRDVLDALIAVCMLLGALLAVSGTLGIVRFPDVLSRLHAATKPQVLGPMLMLAAAGLRVPSWGTISTLILIAAFQVLTLPVAAHMIGRAAYRTKHVKLERLYRDELAEAVERATDDQTS